MYNILSSIYYIFLTLTGTDLTTNTKQAHGENAPSTLTLTYFDELISSKQVVLEMGEFDAQHLKLEEAKQLIHQMKLYYLHTNETDEKYALLNCFTKKPDQFKHMDLIKQLEKDLNINSDASK